MDPLGASSILASSGWPVSWRAPAQLQPRASSGAQCSRKSTRGRGSRSGARCAPPSTRRKKQRSL
eukprot:7169143-Lingulodinium_polyedra.AAC.1